MEGPKNTIYYLGNHVLYHWIFLVLMSPIVIVAIIFRFVCETCDFEVGLQISLRPDTRAELAYLPLIGRLFRK